jgi:aminoglycoside phosphotransferase (APT) family kinase protein
MERLPAGGTRRCHPQGRARKSIPAAAAAGGTALFARHAALLDEITAPRLVHADLWDGNLLAENGRIAAVLDGDRAIYGDPDFEVAGGWLDVDAYYEGYGAPAPQDQARKTRLKLYELLFKLEDAYIMTVEYNKKARGKWHKSNALRIMKELR